MTHADDEDEIEMIAPGFELGYLGGNVPVQAEGTVDGEAFFYFRARGQHWEFHVAPTEGDLFTSRQTFYFEEAYGDDPYAAGWMTNAEARERIVRGAALYRWHQTPWPRRLLLTLLGGRPR